MVSRTVTLVFPKKVTTFYSDRQFATTHTLSAFHMIASPVLFVKFSCKKLLSSAGCHPRDGVTQDSPTSDAN